MPKRDGTGPLGQGTMTGRAAGYCAGNAIPRPRSGFMNRGGFTGMGMPGFMFARDRSFGFGFGRGYARRRMWGGYGCFGPAGSGCFADIPEDEEKAWLTREEQYLEKRLGGIKRRLSQLSVED